MRYHIDTIPLWDALKLQGECPLCAIRRKNELLEVQRYLGASVMEPDTRIQVNDKGFCAHHQAMLFQESNRLGHGLMLHTHLKETQKKLDDTLAQLETAAQQLQGAKGLGRLLKKSGDAGAQIRLCAQKLDTTAHTCVLCDSLEQNMNRYVYTFLHLWKTDQEFRKTLAVSKGICLPDAALILETATEELSSEHLGSLAEAIARLTRENLARIEQELEWFTLKFDYRNHDKPWGNSRDAVERTCNKLRGWCVGDEPIPKD